MTRPEASATEVEALALKLEERIGGDVVKAGFLLDEGARFIRRQSAEIERLRAEVERLTLERDGARTNSKFYEHALSLQCEAAREAEQRAMAAEAREAALKARVAVMDAALEPFAATAENDIGSEESDDDIFESAYHNRVPRPTVGDFRRARSARASADAGGEHG